MTLSPTAPPLCARFGPKLALWPACLLGLSLLATAASCTDDEAVVGGGERHPVTVVGDGWSGVNFGRSEGLGGSSSLTDGVFAITGGGGDFWGSGDDGHFVYRSVAGDFDFSVRVTGYSGYTNANYAKAAVLFKESTGGSEPGPTASGVYQSLNYRTADYWYQRSGSSISSFNSTLMNDVGQGARLRLTRTGNIFRSYTWDEGTSTWTQHGGDRVVALDTEGFIGMGATSASWGSLMTATFDDASFTGVAVDPDTTAPAISNLVVIPAGSTATMTWDTDEPTTSSVDYGSTSAYGSSVSSGETATQHQVLLTGLTETTNYHFQVTATDTSANSISTNDAQFDSGTVPLTVLPTGWSSINLGGSEAIGGHAEFANGVFSIAGGGGDFWGSHDDGHFAYHAVEGDFELIANVDSYSGDTSYVYAKAALLFKEDAGSGAPTDTGRGVYQSLNYRSYDYWYQRTNSITGYNGEPLNTLGGGKRLRLTRTGDTFRTYTWNEGSSIWVQHGGDRILALASSGFLGLGATSGIDSLMTVTFSNVSINGSAVTGAPDETPPVISNVAVTQTDTTATVTWTTNEPATSAVDYGLTNAYGDNQSSAALATSHSVTLTGLSASTTYAYRVSSTDAAANATSGADNSFTTDDPPPPDTTAPIISNVAVSQTDTTATITWTTDEAATSLVDYGLTSSYGGQVSQTPLVSAHSVQLSGLTPSTTYYYRVSSTDAATNPATGSALSFITDAPPSTGTAISAITVSEITLHTARVSWTTSTAATTEIDYDLNTWGKDSRDFALVTSHSVVIDRMISGSPHAYVITAVDGAGDETTSAQLSFNTTAYADDGLPASWANLDIGSVSTTLPGSAQYDAAADGGSFVVRGTGTDVFFSADSYHFVYFPVDGDFVITLKVAGWYGYLHMWGKAMTMFRADLDNDSEMFNQSLNYSGDDYLYYRTPKGSSHTEITHSQINPGAGQQVWARLTRVGDVFTEEYSADGVNWSFHGPSTGTTVDLPTAGYVGFGVCSKSNNYLSEIVYSNVTVQNQPAAPDTTAPVVSNVVVTPAGDSATVTWTTNELATSQVDYGSTTSYGSTATDAGSTTLHEVELTGLTPNSVYHLQVSSADAAANNTVGSDIEFDSGDIPTTALPPGWASVNLGASDAAGGTSSHSGGTFSLQGGGGDLWGSRDDGHYVYQPVNGDFDFIAQVDSYAGDTSYAYAKGALVFKQDTGSGAPTATAPGLYQSLNYRGTDYWYQRGASSITSFNSTQLNTTGGSALLRMTRTGDTFRTYNWNAGTSSWDQHGGDRTVALGANGYVGMAATSGTSNLLTVEFSNVTLTGGDPDLTAPTISAIAVAPAGTTATVTWTTDEPSSSVVDFGLDSSYGQQATTAGLATSHSVVLTGLSASTVYNFRVLSADSSANEAMSADDTFDSGAVPVTSLPANWLNVDLDANVVGNASYDAGLFLVSGGGGDMWGSSDGGHMAYQHIDGDFDLQVTIDSYSGDTSQSYSKGVLVFKQEIGGETAPVANGAGVFQSLNYSAEDYWYQRNTAGSSISSYSSSQLNSAGSSARLRLTRVGDVFRSYVWDDGLSTWTQIGADRTASLDARGYVGMGVTSRTSSLMTVAFSNVSLTATQAN